MLTQTKRYNYSAIVAVDTWIILGASSPCGEVFDEPEVGRQTGVGYGCFGGDRRELWRFTRPYRGLEAMTEGLELIPRQIFDCQ
jgi:hypothetical protein